MVGEAWAEGGQGLFFQELRSWCDSPFKGLRPLFNNPGYSPPSSRNEYQTHLSVVLLQCLLFGAQAVCLSVAQDIPPICCDLETPTQGCSDVTLTGFFCTPVI